MKTQLIVRLANDNPFILPFHQSTKVVACDCHCFNNCLISKVCAQILNLLSYTQISKRPSAAIMRFFEKLAQEGLILKQCKTWPYFLQSSMEL